MRLKNENITDIEIFSFSKKYECKVDQLFQSTNK
jgi:hypothetical protein